MVTVNSADFKPKMIRICEFLKKIIVSISICNKFFFNPVHKMTLLQLNPGSKVMVVRKKDLLSATVIYAIAIKLVQLIMEFVPE